jgi:transcriptional regulator with XRE-family HTH domain
MTTGTNGQSSTVKDVARLAGVSTATVSRVLNGSNRVSREIQTRVLSAISRLRYCPNPYATALGRAKGGIRRKRISHVRTLARTGPTLLSEFSADAEDNHRKIERLRLLEDENSRLRQLLANLGWIERRGEASFDSVNNPS